MAKISRDRGAAFEREVVHLFKDWGHEAFRTAQHMGKTGQAPDVKVKGLHIEAKRRRSVAAMEWYKQALHDSRAGNLPTVIFRADNEPPMVMMAFEDWIQLYNEWNSINTLKERWGIDEVE